MSGHAITSIEHPLIFLAPKASPRKQRKRIKENTPVRRPSTPTPATRPKADHSWGRDHQEENKLSIQQLREAATAILADRARGPRVGSVALLGNQEKVEYYRNDSPERIVSGCCANGVVVATFFVRPNLASPVELPTTVGNAESYDGFEWFQRMEPSLQAEFSQNMRLKRREGRKRLRFHMTRFGDHQSRKIWLINLLPVWSVG
ncbi:hypothetical protein DER45DRAFT_596219 [Fusarium avenaceum]|nr:hypothetical protein DER45DRAFT_596219 [Fusarium avenaceum]